jgi:transcriptional regulator with XRE-family HTH domain
MTRNVTPTGSRKPEFRTLEERLWWARETAPMTQQELADHLGISKRTVQNYEAGVGHPAPSRLLLWANACDVDFDWLAGDFYESPDPRRAKAAREVAVITKGRSASIREYTRTPRPGRSPIASALGSEFNRRRVKFDGNVLAPIAELVDGQKVPA